MDSDETDYPQNLDASRSRTNTNRSKTLVRLGLGLIVFVCGVGAGGGLLAYQASSVSHDLKETVDRVHQLRTQLDDGEDQAAQQTLALMQENATGARKTTTGPLWEVASMLPFVGPNFGAVRDVAVSAEDVVSQAVGPLVNAYSSVDLKELSPANGQIEIARLREAAPDIKSAENAVRLSHERLSALDLSALIPRVAEPIRSATDQLGSAVVALGYASSAAQLLPSMLGADSPRTYLLLVQNSAEVRATGGIPGAIAIVRAESGRITLGEQSSAVALGAFRPALNVDPEQTAIYTARLGTQMQNVNLTPDFPTAAQTAKTMWEQRHPDQILDGVLAMDPLVLSHLLDATGPLDLDDSRVLDSIRDTWLPTSLTADNVVPTLLSDVYRAIDNPEAQDAYFAAVAGRVFSAFAGGQADGMQLVKALERSTKENRLYLWSSHKTEQGIISSTPLHGAVNGAASGGVSFGVYFNDGTGAKMDYYVTRTVALIQECTHDEYGQYTVRITATNNAPADAETSLPAYVTGGGVFGVDPGRVRTNYVVYGPAQAFVDTATVDGQPAPVSSGKHGQRPVGTVQLELSPGETQTIDVTFSKVVQDSEPQLQVTPTIQSAENSVRAFKRETCG